VRWDLPTSSEGSDCTGDHGNALGGYANTHFIAHWSTRVDANGHRDRDIGSDGDRDASPESY